MLFSREFIVNQFNRHENSHVIMVKKQTIDYSNNLSWAGLCRIHEAETRLLFMLSND